MSLADISNADAAGYSVVVSNAFGVVTSSVATLTVPNPPLVTTQPLSQTNNSGTTATFTVTAAGTAPLIYQWLKNTTAISGATGATLTLSSVSDSSAAAYSVVITNAAGSVTSSAAALSVLDVPSITSQPLSRTNIAGTTATFTVERDGCRPVELSMAEEHDGDHRRHRCDAHLEQHVPTAARPSIPSSSPMRRAT